MTASELFSQGPRTLDLCKVIFLTSLILPPHSPLVARLPSPPTLTTASPNSPRLCRSRLPP